MAYTVGDLVATLSLDDRQFKAGVQRSQAGVNKLTGVFSALTSQVTGANPALVRLGSVLGGFAAGGVYTAAALGGFALLGAGWKKLTEGAKEYQKGIEDLTKATEALIRKQQFAGNFDLLKQQANQRARVEFFQPQVDAAQARVNNLKGGLALPGALEDAEADLKRLTEQLDFWKAGLDASTEALRVANPEVEGFTGTVERVADLNAQLGELNVRAAYAAAAVEDMMADAFREPKKQFLDAFGPSGTAMTGITKFVNKAKELGALAKGGGGRLQAGAGGFMDAIKGAFSAASFASIGAGLATNLISTVSGKLLSALGGLFNRVDESQKRLAEAMERNTKALTASSPFLKGRVEGAGLGSFAGDVATVVGRLLDQLAVGETSGADIQRFGRGWLIDALDGIGFDEAATAAAMANLDALARALGLNLDTMNEDTLRLLLESLTKAGYGLDDLADTARETAEALRNVPEGFKIAQAVFDATQGASVAGVGGASAAGVAVNQYGPVYIDARSKPVGEAYDEWASEDARRAVRGGASGFRGRGPG